MVADEHARFRRVLGSGNSYNAYWPTLLVLIVSFLSVSSALSSTLTASPKRGAWLAAIIIFLSVWLGYTALTSAVCLRNMNKAISEVYAEDRALILQVSRFIGEHGDEEDFSVKFDTAKGDPIPEPLEEGFLMTTILFHRYEAEVDPKYVLHFEGGTLHSRSTRDSEQGSRE